MNLREKPMIITSAPLQGYTDYIYRRVHQQYFGGIDNYYTPFLRIEKGSFRNKDIRDLKKENNSDLITPQLLPASVDDLKLMLDKIQELGWNSCDLNFGCPFPMQSKHGRGVGILKQLDQLESIAKYINQYPTVKFSIKTRLGYDNVNEGIEAIKILNDTNIEHITLHARLGIDKYTSPIRLDEFSQILAVNKNDIFYNGNITSLAEAQKIKKEFPQISGVAIGRALLTRPWLASEIKANKVTSPTYDVIRGFHDDLLQAYANHLEGGDHQILVKIKTLWDYLLADMDPKAIKKIKKSTTLAKYHLLVNDFLKRLPK